MKRFFLYHFPMIVYAGIIIFLSSITNLKTPHIRFLAFDKVAHFCEYAIFALLSFRSFSNLTLRSTGRQAFYITSGFLILFAIFDEYFVQSLSRRDSSIYDLLADMGGALVVLVILVLKTKKPAIEESQNL